MCTRSVLIYTIIWRLLTVFLQWRRSCPANMKKSLWSRRAATFYWYILVVSRHSYSVGKILCWWGLIHRRWRIHLHGYLRVPLFEKCYLRTDIPTCTRIVSHVCHISVERKHESSWGPSKHFVHTKNRQKFAKLLYSYRDALVLV